MYRYPFLDIARVNAPYAHRLDEACRRVIDSGRYIGGGEVEEFERELAGYCGCRHAVGTGNGLDALRLILQAYVMLGVMAPGDEVIVSSATYIATFLAVTHAGLIPVPVDSDILSYNIDPGLIARAVTPRTRAIVAVHLYGRPCDMAALREVAECCGLKIIEDSAQAIGAVADGCRAGSLGDAAAFSFYPTKNLGALGDGGAVTTDDPDLADVVRALGNYGGHDRHDKAYCGFNSRLDPLQAAMLRVKLPDVDASNIRRREVAAVYSSAIHNSRVILPDSTHGGHVWHQYVVRVGDRGRFRDYMARHGVETDVHYPVAPYRQACYAGGGFGEFPVTDMLAREIVSLPVNPACTSFDDARAIAEIINSYE